MVEGAKVQVLYERPQANDPQSPPPAADTFCTRSARLWNRLRSRAPGLPVFRRQHPIGPYVLDFYCTSARLAVEVDGIGHDLADRPRQDAQRHLWLQMRGVTKLRIPAGDVSRGIDEVTDAIFRVVQCRLRNTPSTALTGGPPPPLRGGGS
jgi:very-short-patch-repair endonuclease